MRAAVLVGPKEFRIEPVPVKEPDAGEVLIRVEGCGVCASNLPLWEGRPWFKYPLDPGAPGHEAWGRVEGLGAGVEGFETGDRVAFLSGCGFAEYESVSADALVPLPTFLDGKPFPGEPLACAFNIFERSGVKGGSTVAILGIGFLGALLTSLVKYAGGRVIALSRRPFALEVARRFGADEVVPINHRDEVIRQVMTYTGEKGCDIVVEATGHQEPLSLAGELCCTRGRLIVAGYHQDGLREVNMQVWNWKGLDVVNAHERDPEIYLRGMRSAVEAVRVGALNPFPLFTRRFPLEEISSAFDILGRRPEGSVKVLVEP